MYNYQECPQEVIGQGCCKAMSMCQRVTKGILFFPITLTSPIEDIVVGGTIIKAEGIVVEIVVVEVVLDGTDDGSVYS